MRYDERRLIEIKKFVNDYFMENGVSPSVRDVSQACNCSVGTAHVYINRLQELGDIEQGENARRGIVTDVIKKVVTDLVTIPVVGTVKCGPLTFAEQEISEYVRLPREYVGSGDHYILKANGDSMIDAGIEDGDLVLIRKQSTAENRQIIVALNGEETTLKRYIKDEKNKRFILHPENDKYEDIIVDSLTIQGVAEKIVLKNLN